jgi:hypothetical protein
VFVCRAVKKTLAKEEKKVWICSGNMFLKITKQHAENILEKGL